MRLQLNTLILTYLISVITTAKYFFFFLGQNESKARVQKS